MHNVQKCLRTNAEKMKMILLCMKQVNLFYCADSKKNQVERKG